MNRTRILIEHGLASGDSTKAAAANALRTRLDQILESDHHKWYLGKMDPEEAARRRQAQEEFKKRYE